MLLDGCLVLRRLSHAVTSVSRPHLGNAFKQVVAVGLSYFFFAAAFGVTHAMGQVRGDVGTLADSVFGLVFAPPFLFFQNTVTAVPLILYFV